MSYRYVKLIEILKLQRNNRESIVIFNVHTKDLEEYINNCLITLSNMGFNINILLSPKVLSDRNKRIIILTVKNGYTISKQEYDILNMWSAEMGNVTTLNNFLNNNYRLKDEDKKSEVFAIKLQDFKFLTINGKDISSNKQLKIVCDLRIIDRDIQRNTKNVEEYIKNLVKFIYKTRRVFVENLEFSTSINNDDKIEIKIEPTIDSINIKYNIDKIK